MNQEEIINLIKQELPVLVKDNFEIQELIIDLSCNRFADKEKTEDRFDKLLQELKDDRKEQAREWKESKKEDAIKWEEHKKEDAIKWEEQKKEDAIKWEERKKEDAIKWEEQNKKWEEQNKKWEEQNKKWEEQNKNWNKVHNEIMMLERKQESSIGALGARWGIASEESFRNGLKSILKDFSGIEVLNINDYDDEGTVFGRPDQVELDIIIQNSTLIVCEIKSSVSKSDMYIFERKARFYEKRHNRKADRLLVISPMIDPRARPVADALNIECHSSSYGVKLGDRKKSQ